MKQILPVIVIAATVIVVASPGQGCDRHQDHTAMSTVENVPAPPPQTAIEPIVPSNPTLEIKTEDTMSMRLGAAYENCHRSRPNQTVYLTQ